MKKILIIIFTIIAININAQIIGSNNQKIIGTANQTGNSLNNLYTPTVVNPNSIMGTTNQTGNIMGTTNQKSNTTSVTNQSGNNTTTNNKNVPKVSLEGIVKWFVEIMNQLVYVIITLSLVMFLYGIFKLSFVDGQKPESREQSRKFMFWGIVSLFVMTSVWGLVRILQLTIFDNGNLIIPQLKV